MRSLVVYFSQSGSTKMIAEAVARTVGAEILELKPLKKLRGGNFMKHFWGGKQVTRKEQPELEPIIKNAADYDVIIIGTPVWVFNFTPAIRTFLSQAKLFGKKIAFYCCCDSMPGKAIDNMKAELKGNEFIGELVLFKTANNKEKNTKIAVEWAEKLNLTG